MFGRRFFSFPLYALVGVVLAACEPAQVPRQQLVEWSGQSLLFIADSRIGRVRSFFLGNGAPVYFAQTRGVGRASVRDLQLDAPRGQLWVLGDAGVDVHEARGLALQKHFTLDARDARDVSALRIEADRVVLVSATGEEVGQIDSRTLLASWRLPPGRG
jgi:hypothetical protein